MAERYKAVTRYTPWCAHDLSLLVTDYTLRSRAFEHLFGWEGAGHKIRHSTETKRMNVVLRSSLTGRAKSSNQRRRFNYPASRAIGDERKAKARQSIREADLKFFFRAQHHTGISMYP